MSKARTNDAKKNEDKKHSKLQLWLIILITLSVLIGGFVIFPSTEEQRDRLLAVLGTSNKGILLNPVVPLTELTFSDQQGEPWLWQAQAPKWRVLLPVVGRCDQVCLDFLYLSRQVHVRLDKKTQQVQRILLNLGAPFSDETKALLSREHPYLKVIRGDLAVFSSLLASTNAQWSADTPRMFVVDQHGVAMLYYTAEHQGYDLLADLKHLIKYSPEL